MTIANYSELKTEVADFSHRSDLTSKMDAFCLLAEAVINKDLRTLDMESSDSPTQTGGIYVLPADYLEVRRLNVIGDNTPIKFVDTNTIISYNLITGSQPSVFSISEGEIILRPAPSSSSPVDLYLIYFARVPTLTTNSTNDILTNYPLIYLSAMMIQLSLYLQDDDEMAKWIGVYDSQINEANKTAQGGRYVLPQVQCA